MTFHTAALQDSVVGCNVTFFEQLAPAWSPPPPNQGYVDLSPVFLLTVPDSTDVDSLVTRMTTFENVHSASPSHVREYFSIDDPDYPAQWHLENRQQDHSLLDVDIDAEAAWEITLGSPSITVHVLDTGIEQHHDILVDAAASHICTLSSNRIHGTAVAGIIAAKDNSWNVRGVAPRTLVANVEMGGGNPSYSQAICGLSHSANESARIANMSWGFRCPHEFVVAGVRNLYLSGCLLIAGAGNGWSQGDDCPAWPAALNHLVFAASAVYRGGKPYNGLYVNDAIRYIDVAAPGGADVVTTADDPTNGTNFEFGGTSSAAPVVSGIAALLLAENGNLENDDLAHVIARTASDLPPQGPDSLSGAGLVNAHRALQFISSPRVVQQGTIASSNVSVEGTSSLYSKTFKNLGSVLGDPSLPDEETEFLVQRLDLVGTLAVGEPYLTDVRHAWVRHKNGLSPGWPDEDPIDCMRVVGTGMPDSANWGSTSVTFEAFTFAVYELGDTSFVCTSHGFPRHPALT